MDPYSQALAEGIDEALPTWVQRCVRETMMAWRGEIPDEVAAAAAAAGRRAAQDVGAQVRALLDADVDEQRTTPLSLVRAAVAYPTAVLAAAGAPPAQRDRFVTDAFPADAYDLSPASWADVDPALTGPALAWGAAKAFEHKRRHNNPAQAGGSAQ
ncbi:MAG TPA: hypothetical protein VG184_03605 [Acidimicrobiales bacterium]|nr:hypothetical protein [Acidimicrobiales bacterium]